jgi:hypothetical protein
MAVSITMKIDPKLSRQLDPKQYDRALKRAMSPATKIVFEKVREYPPNRPGSSYIRTYNLRRSWRRRITNNAQGVVGIVESSPEDARYNIWVKSPQYQAGIHRGLWPTTQADADNVQDKVEREFQKEIDRALEGK